MKSLANWIFLILLFHSPSRAQESRLICGNELFSSIIHEHFPGLEEGFRTTFEDALSMSPGSNQEDLTVQVFVHIVWKYPEENLHDSIIEDQMRVLNEDFNRLNADTAHLRARFASEAGVAGIRFELAGIQRVNTSVDFEINPLGTNLLPEVKHSTQGGSDAIDPEHYLNIWVCHIQPIEIFGIVIGQILGFAFPPHDLPHWPSGVGAPSPDEDGVVIDYRVFGSNNPNPIEIPGGAGTLVVKGRTPTHEVGHYLGLRHIWGDGGLLGPNDCAQSDGIEDTPYANAQSAFDCDTTKNSCTGIESHYGEDMPDLIENYMDYASEDCMNMFTHGQCALMRNVILGPRVGLISPVSAVSLHADRPGWQVHPNPAGESIQVKMNTSFMIRGQWKVYSPTGNCFHSWPVTHYQPGNHVHELDVSFLLPGMYILTWQDHQGIQSQKILKH